METLKDKMLKAIHKASFDWTANISGKLTESQAEACARVAEEEIGNVVEMVESAKKEYEGEETTKLIRYCTNGPLYALIKSYEGKCSELYPNAMLCTFETEQIRDNIENGFDFLAPNDTSPLPDGYYFQVMNEDNDRLLVAKICKKETPASKEKPDFEKIIGELWEEVNKQFIQGVNPNAFRLGGSSIWNKFVMQRDNQIAALQEEIIKVQAKYDKCIKVIKRFDAGMEKPRILRGIDQNFTQLETLVERYIENISNGQSNKNMKQYIFEAAMTGFFGEKVFDWINHNDD